MFRWRRKNDGFEWREYVRTTILVRRGDRRRRVEDIKDQAVAGLKDAGVKGAGVAATGLKSTGLTALSALRWIAALPGRLIRWTAPRVLPPIVRAATPVLITLEPTFATLRRREVRTPLLIITAIAAFGAGQRTYLHGYDQEVLFALLIAAAAGLLVLVPAWAAYDPHAPSGWLLETWRRFAPRWPIGIRWPTGFRWPAEGPQTRTWLAAGAGLAGLVVVGLGANALIGGGDPTEGDQGKNRAEVGDTGRLQGPAVALSGDTIRIANRIVRLTGIEAPDLEQDCDRRGSNRWRCGEAARAALARLLRGRRIDCKPSGMNGSDPIEAACQAQDDDISLALVRGGHVFAGSSLFSGYTSTEETARAEGVGLWAGTPDRPEAYRARKWEEARRAAPDGCPIKGQIANRDRVYVLPWSRNYDRVKVREARGERWFCSEDEAKAAGWRATVRS
ncbi:MAG: thermonuclease family protein [Hyphomicrobium sp.]